MSDEAMSHILVMSWLGDRQRYNLNQANDCSGRHVGSWIIKEAPKMVTEPRVMLAVLCSKRR